MKHSSQPWMLMMTRSMVFSPLLTDSCKKIILQLTKFLRSWKKSQREEIIIEQQLWNNLSVFVTNIYSTPSSKIVKNFMTGSRKEMSWYRKTHTDQQEPSTANGPGIKPSSQKF